MFVMTRKRELWVVEYNREPVEPGYLDQNEAENAAAELVHNGFPTESVGVERYVPAVEVN